MTREEETEMRDTIAMISLPGVVGKSGLFATPESIAVEAYDIAEAMITERNRRLGLTPNPNENASIH